MPPQAQNGMQLQNPYAPDPFMNGNGNANHAARKSGTQEQYMFGTSAKFQDAQPPPGSGVPGGQTNQSFSNNGQSQLQQSQRQQPAAGSFWDNQ